MKYNISKTTPPAMPHLGRGTECVTLLLSQVSRDMQQSVTPMLFPILGAHISGAQFMYPDLSWKEPCGMLANLVADSGAGKGQLSSLVEAVCRDFRQHDDEELSKLVEWQKMMKTKSANKEKPARPDVAFWFPPADVTNAARLQRLRRVLPRGTQQPGQAMTHDQTRNTKTTQDKNDHATVHHPILHQERARAPLLPHHVRPTRGRQPAHVMDTPLPAPARSPAGRRLPQDSQVALAARGATHRRPPRRTVSPPGRRHKKGSSGNWSDKTHGLNVNPYKPQPLRGKALSGESPVGGKALERESPVGRKPLRGKALSG